MFNARQQAFFPTRLAGLGLSSLYTVNPSAFLAASIQSSGLLAAFPEMKTFFDSIPPLRESLSGERISEEFFGFKNALVTARFTLPDVVRVRVPEFNSGTSKLQQTFCKLIDERKFKSFCNDLNSDWGRAHLLSCSGPGAGAWLTAPTRYGKTKFSSEQFISSACRLLDLPQPAILDAMVALQHNSTLPTELVKCCLGSDLVCNAVVSTNGHHFSVCKHGNLRFRRHDAIIRVLKPVIEDAGYGVSLENDTIYPPLSNGGATIVRKMDIVAVAPEISEDAPASSLCIDVSVVDATSDLNSSSTTLQPGSRGGSDPARTRLHAAKKRVKQKKDHYRDTPTPYELIPFVVEANGALSAEASKFIKNVCRRVVAVKGAGRFTSSRMREIHLRTELTTQISVALQKVHADNFKYCSVHIERCNLRDTSRRISHLSSR
jgi:hypothetical protein